LDWLAEQPLLFTSAIAAQLISTFSRLKDLIVSKLEERFPEIEIDTCLVMEAFEVMFEVLVETLLEIPKGVR